MESMRVRLMLVVCFRKNDGHRREGIVTFSVGRVDGFHVSLFPGRKGHYFIAFPHYSRSNFGREASEVEIRTQYVLHRIAEVGHVVVVADMYGFKEVEQRRTFVPWGAVGFLHHVVPVECGQRDARDIGHSQRGDECLVVGHNSVEHLFREVHQVHLVYGQYHMLDAQQ